LKATHAPVFDSINDIDAVDLSRHALIEASAGTGKTYTIENLVVRLLKETPDLDLENILLVTFTEKATGELKQRIRLKITQTLDDDDGLRESVRRKLSDALDSFDNAAIYTIHGFCHTLLREFPFEMKSLFKQELVDDDPLLEKLLKEQIRSDWPRRFGHRLETLLTLADFSEKADAFVAATVDLARRLHGEPDREIVIPDPAGLDVDELWENARRVVRILKTLVGPSRRFSDGYARLNINARTKTAMIRDVVAPLEQALAAVDEDGHPLGAVIPLIKPLVAGRAARETKLARLVPEKWLKAGENLDVCPNLDAIKERLAELGEVLESLTHVLMLTSLDPLRKAVKKIKACSGWISYRDMLTQVADFLAAPGAGEGIRRIRARYRVAFVDEFQDTDDLQWRIFRTLFMEADSPNRLFLIGDPKQAIYGFRGADVFTYLEARQQMVRLTEQGTANLYDLAVNWRSTPSLVACFNRVFAQDDWFGDRECKGPFEIGYPQASSPPVERLPLSVAGDGSRRPPFNVVDLTAAGDHRTAKSWLMGFICREIRFLIEKGNIRIDSGDGTDRSLHYGDIAVLVRSQGEFDQLEPLLEAWSIPWTYYRKPGLFQCRQAHWLSMVLKAVCNPAHAPTVRLALLTPFFDIPPESLAVWPELPADHPSQRLLSAWHDHARQRRWGRLFQSLLEESGLTIRHCSDPDWERSETNLRQLFDFLEASAHGKNLDMVGVTAFLDKLRLFDGGAGSDADVHQIEDEGDKVQILTMHVSKGLEFPVVFIAGGLTTRMDSGIQAYHRMDPAHPERGWRRMIDLMDSSGWEQARNEHQDENKRLYYVALTRARVKLYVPYYPDSRNYGWVGPVCRFVSRSIADAFHPDGKIPLPEEWHRVDETAITPPSPVGSKKMPEPSPSTVRLPAGQLLPAQTDFRRRSLSLESFSSINHRINRDSGQARPAHDFSLSDASGREDDEPSAVMPDEWPAPDLSASLPGGTTMGSMFHHIFETIDFQAVMDGPQDILDDEDLNRVVESAATLYRISPIWLPQIGRTVADTLRQTIAVHEEEMTLGQLSPDRRRHEIEFYFPLLATNPDGSAVPEMHVSEDPCRGMVLRGFIDLLFSWQGRFYIADWKSNRLPEGYHRDVMSLEMAAAGYDLQYRLYTLATLRWLHQRLGPRFDPEAHFGGVYYFFIRGMGGEGGEGVFHVPPDRLLPIKILQESVQEQITGIKW
jgi:exodeoxyribonuclease V beta subunit